MRRHLYDRSNNCPCVVNNVILTDETKEFILENIIYKPAVLDIKQSITNINLNQSINQYNILNNYIGILDSLEKLNKYIVHNNTNIFYFESHVESKCFNTVNKL